MALLNMGGSGKKKVKTVAKRKVKAGKKMKPVKKRVPKGKKITRKFTVVTNRHASFKEGSDWYPFDADLEFTKEKLVNKGDFYMSPDDASAVLAATLETVESGVILGSDICPSDILDVVITVTRR